MVAHAYANCLCSLLQAPYRRLLRRYLLIVREPWLLLRWCHCLQPSCRLRLLRLPLSVRRRSCLQYFLLCSLAAAFNCSIDSCTRCMPSCCWCTWRGSQWLGTRHDKALWGVAGLGVRPGKVRQSWRVVSQVAVQAV